MCVVDIPRSRCTGNALNFFYSDGAAVDGSTLPTDNAPGNPANSRPLEPRQRGGSEWRAILAHMPRMHAHGCALRPPVLLLLRTAEAQLHYPPPVMMPPYYGHTQRIRSIHRRQLLRQPKSEQQTGWLG